MWRFRLLLVGLTLMAAGWPRLGRAEESYQSLVEHGIEEYKLGHWIEAKSYFERAHAVQPNARTLRGLGLVSFELRQYVSAITFLSQALVSQERPLTAAMRTAAEQLLASARGFIAYYQLELEPKSTQITIDGQPPVFDEHGLLMLEATSHELILSASDRQTLVRTVNASPGTRGTLRVELPPQEVAKAPPPDAALAVIRAQGSPPKERGWSMRRWSALGIGGAGALSLVAAGVCTGFAVSYFDRSKQDCQDNACGPSGLSDREIARTFGDAASVTLIAGAALLGTATVLFVTEPRVSDERVGVRAAPLAGPGMLGVSIAGKM